MLAGIKVFRPLTEDTPIDLLLLRDKVVLKCQCKYIYPTKKGSHKMNLFTVRKWGPNSRARKHLYTNDEVDFFLGYCLDNDSVYILPYEEVAPRSEVTFWVSRSPKGQNHHERFDPEPWRNNFTPLSS